MFWQQRLRTRVHPISLHGILRGPFPCRAIVSNPIRFEQLSNIRYQRIVGVGIGKKRANAQQNFRNRQCRTPLILEDI
jgi:hypothetical protein